MYFPDDRSKFVIVISYDLMKSHIDSLLQKNFRVVILVSFLTVFESKIDITVYFLFSRMNLILSKISNQRVPTLLPN